MHAIKVKLDKHGTISVPVEYQKLLGLTPGDELILKLEHDEIRVVPSRRAIQRAQTLVRKYISADHHLADELIQDRREEGERE